MDNLESTLSSNNVAITCPLCDKVAMTNRQTISFQYDEGESAVVLSASLPVRSCTDCEFDFLDRVGQELKHEAVCRHLNVLTPREIKAIRDKNRMTRAEFATLTGLGEAAIGRWERSEQIQSVANDRYLRRLATRKRT